VPVPAAVPAAVLPVLSAGLPGGPTRHDARVTDDGLRPLSDTSTAWSARKVVRALGLRELSTDPPRRPRVLASMIASADGRVAVQGRSVGLGHPADRALLRELRTAVDAILVGMQTLRAERYANLLDDEQRAHRAASGLEPEPIVATVSRRLDLPADIALLAEPTARVQVYTEADGEVPSQGAWVAVHRFEPGQLTMAAILEHLRTERGARTVLCEGGPTLLRELVAADCVDDLMLTVAPLLVAGDAPTALRGSELEPPAGLALRDIHRADDHLFLHYTLPAPAP
jgi:riboflavin biosynthesis pyrimidine reductase